MEKNSEDIALFDMDGTLCDYEKGLIESLEKLRSPLEQPLKETLSFDLPDYLRARSDLIRSSSKWWAYLPQFNLGFIIWQNARAYGYRCMVLTQGPKDNPHAWAGKKMWIDKNLGENVDITITRDKGLVYGKILVDDWPPYITRWLEWRPRGLVIMPASKINGDFEHPQVIRYDGENMGEVKKRMIELKK